MCQRLLILLCLPLRILIEEYKSANPPFFLYLSVRKHVNEAVDYKESLKKKIFERQVWLQLTA